MSNQNKKLQQRVRRKRRIRRKVSGSSDRPRLSVFRSARHIYAQVIDDSRGVTVASASTLAKDVREEAEKSKKLDSAKAVGRNIAKLCAEAGIQKVVFDRNGYIYHGRIRALAEAAREAGLNF